MKSRLTITIEGLCYVTIAAGAPFVELLISDRDLTQRAMTAAGVMAMVAAANALKAFLSQSMASASDKPIEVVAPPGKPLKTQDVPAPSKARQS